jgi:predicted dehydrogenase
MLYRIDPKPRLRLGLIGPGDHARSDLLPSGALLEQVQWEAISSRNLEMARSVADRWRARFYTDDWRKLIDPEIVDAIVVSASPMVHSEVAAACLPRGIHVFVEKPPSLGGEDLAALIELEAKHSSTVGFVGFNFPYGASYREFQRVLCRNGAIKYLEIRFVSSNPLASGASYNSLYERLLYEAGIHPINMSIRLFGTPRHVTAWYTPLEPPLAAVGLMIAFDGGQCSLIKLGNYSNRFEYRCEAIAASGVSGVLDQHNHFEFTNLPESEALRDIVGGKETTSYRWPSRRGGYTRTGYQAELESFVTSILEKKESTSSFRSCSHTYKVIDHAVNQLNLAVGSGADI